MVKPLFAAEGIGKSFGRRTVLKAASIWVRPGRITALFGRNGSGKTTLLRCAVGLMRADHGAVHFLGESFLSPRLDRLARMGLMYVPAEGALIRGRELRGQLRGLAWRYRVSRSLEEVAESMNLVSVLDAWTDELSGGEKRRGSVAAALIREPRCLLIDEPFAGVAPRDAELVSAALHSLAARGCAILVTGHEVRIVMENADDVIWMAAGTTHGLGSPESATLHDQFRREYLGPGVPSPAAPAP